MSVKQRITISLAAAALATTALIKPWESRVYFAYKGVDNIWSVCDGHTGPDIIIGKKYSDQECDQLLARDVAEAARNVERGLERNIPLETMASFISFEYNTGAFQKSTLRKMVNAGDLVGACKQLSRWVYVKGAIVQGLINRRVNGDATRLSEQSMCLAGLGIRPSWFEKVLARVMA